jgi:hypothetical protein
MTRNQVVGVGSRKTSRLLAFFLLLSSASWTGAQTPPQSPGFAPGKYCCNTPESGYVGCITFKSDGSYEATGKFHDKAGTARGSWKRAGNQILLTPQKETGSLVG